MSYGLIGILLFVSFFGLTMLNVPIAFALGLSSAIALFASHYDTILVPQRMLVGLDSFVLLAVPLFVLAGVIMERGGVARRLFDLASSLVGHIRGGVGMVVILSTIFFSGMSGSSTADTAAIGSIAIPEMVRKRYRPEFATSLVASSGAIAVLIPPCIIMIIYGVVGNVSIAALFAAGFIPGAVMGLGQMIITYVSAMRQGIPREPRASVGEVFQALRATWHALLLPTIVLGGILTGVFTATEAAVIAVVCSFVLGGIVYRELTWEDMYAVLVDTVVINASVMMLLATATIFGWILTYLQIPQRTAALMLDLSSSPWIFLLMVNFLFIIVGTFLDAVPALIILVPILLPAATRLGIDPVHFGVVVVANLGIGFVTPPVGICLFPACSISRIPISAVVRPLIPFFLMMIITLLVVTYVPSISLFIPRLAGY